MKHTAPRARARGSVNVSVTNPLDRVSKWMLDTGASYHMINYDSIVNPDERIRVPAEIIVVNTANGPITLDEELDTPIPVFQRLVTVKVGRWVSNILSVGLLCKEFGYRFEWSGNREPPKLWDSQGTEIRLWIEHSVPFMDPNSTPLIFPFVEGGSRGSAGPTAPPPEPVPTSLKGGVPKGATHL